MQLPLIGSPLFIISNPDLVIAQCKAGIIGSFPSLNARPLPQLEEWLQRLNSELGPDDAPYAVNLIVHKSTDRLMADLELCVKYKVPVIITSLGAREDVNAAIHSYGGIVLHDVINNRFAKKAIEKGADGIIAVAAGAGGHAGTLSPFALVSEIREWFDGPLALSGAMGTGAAILGAEAMGADFGYMGSAFIATTEARADERYIRRSWRAQLPTSSIPTCSPACRATTSVRRSWPPALTRTISPRATTAPWTSAAAATPTPRPGATSGARARASAR
jgi:nitronate monooxygenase